VFRRWACEQIDPGDADPRSAARALLFTFQSVPTGLHGVVQTRRFRASGEPRDIVLCELAQPLPGSYRAYAS
jgi:hypothetical protein